MSMAVVAIGAGIGLQYNAAKNAADAQKDAQRQAREDALRTADLADQAANRANRKRAGLQGLLAGDGLNKGVGSTMLTGPQGIDPSQLTLGRNTLLGA